MIARLAARAGWGLWVLAVLAAAPAHGRGAGCPTTPEPAARYRARAKEARAAGDYTRAADELWGAWCAARDAAVRAQICMVHGQAGSCQQGQDIPRFAERRMGSLKAPARKLLRRCGEQPRPICAGAPPAAAEHAAAPPEAP